MWCKTILYRKHSQNSLWLERVSWKRVKLKGCVLIVCPLSINCRRGSPKSLVLVVNLRLGEILYIWLCICHWMFSDPLLNSRHWCVHNEVSVCVCVCAPAVLGEDGFGEQVFVHKHHTRVIPHCELVVLDSTQDVSRVVPGYSVDHRTWTRKIQFKWIKP